MGNGRYRIIESELGPLLSESRMTVYDVMEAYDSGLDKYQISLYYNLTPLQVQTALDYIGSTANDWSRSWRRFASSRRSANYFIVLRQKRFRRKLISCP
jgi:hypothetical protein